MPQLFISHASGDKQFVEEELLGICRALKLRTWYSAEDIEGGAHFPPAILTALETSDLFALVMSKRSAESRWVRYEVHWALENMPDCVIPILIEDCNIVEISLGLSPVEYVDFRSSKKGREDLIGTLVRCVYEPVVDYTAATLTGTWNSYWETKARNEPVWVSEELKVTLRCGVYSMEAKDKNGKYEWVGHGRFHTSSVFVFPWRINYKRSEWSGVGAVYLNPLGTYMVGHWYGPNSNGEPIIGRWIITRADVPDVDPVQLAKDWFGLRTADSLKPFVP